MNLRTSQQLLLMLLTLIVGIGVLAAIVIFPAIRDIRELTESIANERKRIQTTVQRALTIRELTEQLTAVESALPDLQSMLIPQGEEIELFNTLEQESRRLALTETLRLDEAENTSAALKKIPIQIDLKGSFINTLKFLETVEKNKSLIPIHKISLRTIFSQSPTRSTEFYTTLNGNLYVK